METVIELPENLDKICRTCLSISSNNRYENALYLSNKSTFLCTMLSSLTSVEISADNRLPPRICNTCCEQIKLFYAFKEQWVKIELSLKQFFFDNLNGIEIEVFKKESLTSHECNVCLENFESLYELRKHHIVHNENKSLTDRYYNERNQSIETTVECKISKEMILMLDERKERSDNNTVVSENISTASVVSNNKHTGRYIPKLDVESTDSFQCDMCDSRFSNHLIFMLHFLKHATLVQNDSDEFKEHYIFCSYCGVICENNDFLDNHILENHFNENNIGYDIPVAKADDNYIEKTVYTCPLCNEMCISRDSLHKHSIIHLIKKFKCPLCKTMFITELAFNEHMKKHPSYKHACDICNKRLSSRAALNNHRQIVHSNVNAFSCNVCQKSFKTQIRLKFHNKRHSTEKNYVCIYCGYCTNTIGNLEVHNRVHTLERPYKCTYSNCKKSFKTSSHLSEHSRRHFQIRRFKCNVCSALFSHTNSLKKHMMQHTGEKPFECNFCDSKFSRKDHLKIHMKKHQKL